MDILVAMSPYSVLVAPNRSLQVFIDIGAPSLNFSELCLRAMSVAAVCLKQSLGLSKLQESLIFSFISSSCNANDGNQ